MSNVRNLDAAHRVLSERRAARFEDFEFLTEQGIDPVAAALRAGWPSLAAAEIAFRRARHPRWIELARAYKHQRDHHEAVA